MARRQHHLVLERRFLFQDAQRGEVVLDFLEAREHRLAVGRHLHVVRGDRLVARRPAQPAVEDALDRRGAERPEAARRGEQVGEVGGAKAARPGKRERREVRGLGDADLRVRGDQGLLGLADIGAPLEQCRGQARGRHGRDRQLRKITGGELEIEPAGQRSEQMLRQRSLTHEVFQLSRRVRSRA